MARLPRLIVPGHPHIVRQKGNNGQPVFIDPADQHRYLDTLRDLSRVHRVAIHAYGLLENEVLLLATPSESDALSKLMQAMGRRYVAAFNQRHHRTGTLWEGRYRATLLEGERFVLPAMVFVETAPTRSNLPSQALLAVTSEPHHVGRSTDTLITEHSCYWGLGNTPFERDAAYNLLLQHGLEEGEVSQIEAASRNGWPLGTEQFLDALSLATARRITKLKPGRPRST